MAEQKPFTEEEYLNEAKRIIREYLSQMGWVRSHKDSIYRELMPTMPRDEVEEKLRDITQREEDVEWKFGQDVDKWRKSTDPNRKIVLEEIVKAMWHRNDLGFFGRRIVDRVKREISIR